MEGLPYSLRCCSHKGSRSNGTEASLWRMQRITAYAGLHLGDHPHRRRRRDRRFSRRRFVGHRIAPADAVRDRDRADRRTLYCGSRESRVRVISVDGMISTFAGGGEIVPADLPIRATEAKLVQPRNVAVDRTGAVYISDFGGNKVYRVTSDGMLSTIAGTGEKLSGPAGLAIDSNGALLVADSGNHCIRKIVNGSMETITDSARNPLDFGAVTSIALDAAGRLHAAGGTRILVVTSAGTVGAIETPADEVFIDASGRLLTAAYRQVRSYEGSTVKILAGSGSGGFAGDGSSPDEWRIPASDRNDPGRGGTLYIADTANGRVRRIASDGSLSTVAAGLGYPGYFALDRSNLLYFSDSKTGTIHMIDRAGRLQVFSRGSGAKPFRAPTGIAFDARGDLFVADTGNNLIRKITPDGFVSTVAGGGSSEKDGFGLSLELKSPVGLAVSPEGEIWFTETTRLRKLTSDAPGVNDLRRPADGREGNWVRFERSAAHSRRRWSSDHPRLPRRKMGAAGRVR